jgi:hypothetical protein
LVEGISINKIIFYYRRERKFFWKESLLKRVFISELTKAKNIVWTELSVLLQKNNAYAIQLRIP